MKKNIFITVFILLSLPLIHCQDTLNMIPYHLDFRFVKGVYRTFEEFRENSPSIQYNYEVVFTTTNDRKSRKKDYVKYLDPATGNYENLFQGDIWGFTDGNAVYKLYGDVFFRLGEIKPVMWMTCNTKTNDYYGITGVRLEKRYESFTAIYDLETDSVYNPNDIKELEKMIANKLPQDTISENDTNKTVFMRIGEYNADHTVYFPVNIAKKDDDPFGF